MGSDEWGLLVKAITPETIALVAVAQHVLRDAVDYDINDVSELLCYALAELGVRTKPR